MAILGHGHRRATAKPGNRGTHGKQDIEIELLDLPARTKGTFLLLLAEFSQASALFVGLGTLGKRAEQVADEACLWLEKFLAGTGAIDEYLADHCCCRWPSRPASRRSVPHT